MDTSADPPIGGKGKAKAKASSSAGGGDPAKAQHLPWVEKYRPAGLNDLVAHEDIVRTIRTLISKDQLPHLLLHGPPGTGKTSTILAAAKEMYGPQYGSMTLELNASDDRGIDVRALRCAAPPAPPCTPLTPRPAGGARANQGVRRDPAALLQGRQAHRT
jgi:replication factor C subunit 3/5